jgi:RNA polymerase sigma factor (sigma-70 family)
VKRRTHEHFWPDARLVRGCLHGSEDAWEALLEKYKNLIFSIPVRQGIPRDDAADIFQRVCLLLLAELRHLRQPEALPMWLIRVTARECQRWRRQARAYTSREPTEAEMTLAHDEPLVPDEMLARIREEQMLREAVMALPPRCRKLIELLFFESPAQPYREVARSLGLATGSIGFIRGRCLARLRQQLEKMGLR